jgi:hypothetical protein
MISYSFAEDKDGQLVDISTVTEETRHAGYRCHNWGEEMVPVLGDKKEHHFRHLHTECNYETQIHRLAKERLREAFYSSKKFVVCSDAKSVCKYKDSCKFANDSCVHDIKQPVDLKEFYDTCELEASTYEEIDAETKRFVPDLTLTSSKDPEKYTKIFLEVLVTSPCSEDKLKSKSRIVEIKFPGDDREVDNTLNKYKTEDGYCFTEGEQFD